MGTKGIKAHSMAEVKKPPVKDPYADEDDGLTMTVEKKDGKDENKPKIENMSA